MVLLICHLVLFILLSCHTSIIWLQIILRIMLYDISCAINSRSFLAEKISLFCEIDKFYPVCCCHCLELFWPHYLRLDWSWKIETRSPLWHINTKIAVVAAENDLLYYSSLLFYCLAIIFLSFVERTMDWIKYNSKFK